MQPLLAKSYKREVILGMVWICMYRFGLVYSHSVFKTCLNICYWCMNNTAIYNLFSGKKTGHCHQERQYACLHGNCLCFGSLQGQNKPKTSPSSTTFSRWGGDFELLLCQTEPPLEHLCQLTYPGKPKASSWGSSRLSLCPVLKPSLVNVKLCHLVKACHPYHLVALFLQPVWKPVFFPVVY